MLNEDPQPTEAAAEQPIAGWYPCEGDPPEVLRWWDGTAWTKHTLQAGPETRAAVRPSHESVPGSRIHASSGSEERPEALLPFLVQCVVASVVMVVVLGWVGARARGVVYVLTALSLALLAVAVLGLLRRPPVLRGLARLGAGFVVCALAAAVARFLIA